MKHKRTQELFRQTLEQMHEGIQILGRDWRYVYINEAACLHGRVKKEDVLDHKITDIFPGIEQTEMFFSLRRCMDENISTQLENEFQFPDGSKRWFELFVTPHHEGILIRSIDITEQKCLQEQLWHAQKLDAIGLLAGNLAHDLHNKFNIMLLQCENALRLSEDPALQKSIQSVTKAVKDSTRLTKQLLAFSRRQVLDLEQVNLNDMLKEYEKTLPPLMGENIEVRYLLSPSLKDVYVDRSQFDQVILNLCNNARDAMTDGGVLSIETTMTELDSDYASGRPDVIPGEHVTLIISDTGTGMSREVAAKVFEPFFTTKDRGKGTGLGLPAVQGIIKQCKGHIWVYSEPGVGTTFKIYLPVASQLASVTKHQTPKDPSHLYGTETILLLEDEPALLDSFKSILKDAGYKVLTASHADEARKIFETQAQAIDLMATDLFLPDTTGQKLAQEFQSRHPQLKVVFLSGYTENSIVHNGALDTDSVLIEKPISTKTFLQVIRDVLDEKVHRGVF